MADQDVGTNFDPRKKPQSYIHAGRKPNTENTTLYRYVRSICTLLINKKGMFGDRVVIVLGCVNISTPF